MVQSRCEVFRIPGQGGRGRRCRLGEFVDRRGQNLCVGRPCLLKAGQRHIAFGKHEVSLHRMPSFGVLPDVLAQARGPLFTIPLRGEA